MKQTAWGLTCAALLCSCSLLVSLDGLSGSDASGDAGLDSSSVPVDARAETGTSDAGDGGIPIGTSFCSTADASFCEDFDESSNPQGRFQSQVLLRTGTLTLDSTTFLSSPSALLSSTPPIEDGGERTAVLYNGQPNTLTSEIDMSFDAYVQTVDTTSAFSFGGFAHGVSATTFNGAAAIGIETDGTITLFDIETAGLNEVRTSLAVPLRTWARWTLRLQFGAGNGGADLVTLYLSGVQVASQPAQPSFKASGDPQLVSAIGLVGITSNGGDAIDYDNVTVSGF